MVETFQKKLSDSAAWRWTALVLLASAMFFGYIFVDILSPLKDLLQTQRGWDSVAFGHYAGSEPFLNVFVFFLIFAGIILDKMGVRFTAILSGSVMVLGAALNWYAVTDSFETSGLKSFMDGILNLPSSWWNVTPWYEGMPASAKLAAIGFMIFGCGTEMAGITVSRGIVKWFTGHEMALAMGVEMAIARVGVAVVMLGAPVLANITPVSVSRPVAFSLALLCIGLMCFITYGFMDKKLDAQGATEEKDEPFKVKDIGKILSLRMFWIVALLCVLYYSAIFPFQKYAINMLQCDLGFTASQAGLVFFVFPLGAAAITPFLGISFSLVPAAMWPSVPKLIDNKLLGSAYALIFWIQNIGLYAFPMIIGSVLAACNPGVTDPTKLDYTVPMCLFASLGVLALFLGLYLKLLDKKGGYGLEEPNIKD